MTTRQLYLDCDGVLANFDKKATEVFGGDPRAWEENYANNAYQALYAEGERASGLGPSDTECATLFNKALKLAAKAFWEKLYGVEDLFEQLEPMADAHELMDAVKHLDPIILTGCPRGYWAVPQKLRWRDKYFPNVPMICVESRLKSVYCRPGDVLVDDWPKYRTIWEEKGGLWVHHEDAPTTIDQLRKLAWL